MDFETSKENIQPLRGGRKAEQLEMAINNEKHSELLAEQRKQHELNIESYCGDDPLEAWYDFIVWIEQSYPKSGKESALDEIILRCIETFEDDERYRQDRRMVKIYMKFIDTRPNPTDFYQELYNQGIGTMVADLYIGWAYYYDAIDNFKQAEAIYRKGLDARAQPLEDLENAHKQFGFSMSQRILYRDEPGNQQQFLLSLEERRSALASLKAYKKKHVGSARTGGAVLSQNPGRVVSENEPRNQQNTIQVYGGESHAEVPQRNESVVRSILNSAKKQENTHEPGPWSKAKLGKSGAAVSGAGHMSFAVLEDDNAVTPIPYLVRTYDLGIQKPPGFVARNEPQNLEWNVNPIEETLAPGTFPMYPKTYLYPKPGQEFSSEELRAYRWSKKHDQNNNFVEEREKVWANSYEAGIRLYPGFPKTNLPQDMSESEDEEVPQRTPGMVVKDVTESIEEMYMKNWVQKAEARISELTMEETLIEDVKRRVSIHPLKLERDRQSMARKSVFPKEPEVPESKEDMFRLPALPPHPQAGQSQGPFKHRDSIQLFKDKYKVPEESGVPRAVPAKRKAEQPSDTESVKSPCTIETPPKQCAEPAGGSGFTGFAVPKAPPSGSKTPFPIFEDESPKPAKVESASPYYDPNETCSTQNFSLFLKLNSVSTPIGAKQAKKRVEEAEVEKIEKPSAAIPETSSEPQDHQAITLPPKQLSTILETTEPTSSTGVTTKSTISSPENETEVQKPPPPSAATSAMGIGFQIFEDKTETLQPLKQRSLLFLGNESKIEKENMNLSRIPNQSTFLGPVSNLGALPIFNEREEEEIQQAQNSMESLRIPGESTHPVLAAPEKSKAFCSPELSFFGLPEGGNTMKEDLEPPKPTKNPSFAIFADFEKSPSKEPSKTTEMPAKNLSSEIFSDSAKSPKPVVSKKRSILAFKGFTGDSPEPHEIFRAEGKVARVSEKNEFYDLFAKSPEKKPTINQYGSPLSQEFSSGTDSKDSTQVLLKLNVNDLKNISLLAKHKTQVVVKEEKSLHIEDRQGPPVSGVKKPLYAEDELINTVKFMQFTPNVQNSTLIGSPREMEPKTNLKPNLTLSFNEDELVSLAGKPKTVKPKAASRKSRFSVMPCPPQKPSGVPEDDLGLSIYVPESQSLEEEEIGHSWDESDEQITGPNEFLRPVVDKNETCAIINEYINEEYINPFEPELISAFLGNMNFLDRISSLSSCSFVHKMGHLKPNQKVFCGGQEFQVLKAIGKGSFGTVYKGKCIATGKVLAMKQEKPMNLWEYYICLEIGKRLANPEVISGFMQIEYALVANNMSVLVSEFSPYGTLIDVCNKVNRLTRRNVDEFVVMHLVSHILLLIDHLHGSKIIHADIKPDNFLLKSPLEYGSSKPCVQLIDFGISIDMTLLPQNVHFMLVETNACPEMCDGRPWTYQVDLFGVAGTAHALLFGQYMQIEKKLFKWGIKSKLPRYYNKSLWDNFFSTLLNIRSCNEMPNLQALRGSFQEELINKDRLAQTKLHEFNNLLLQK